MVLRFSRLAKDAYPRKGKRGAIRHHHLAIDVARPAFGA